MPSDERAGDGINSHHSFELKPGTAGHQVASCWCFSLRCSTGGTKHLCGLSLCVCVKVQEDLEATGSERRQDKHAPTLFFGTAGP